VETSSATTLPRGLPTTSQPLVACPLVKGERRESRSDTEGALEERAGDRNSQLAGGRADPNPGGAVG